MNNKIKYIIFIIVAVVLVGCRDSEATKIINKAYIEKNNGIVFDNYAIALDEENNNGKNYALFEKKSTDRYKKLIALDSFSTKDKILYTDEAIYLFGYNGGIVGYKINTKSIKKIDFVIDDADGLILYPVEVYGYFDGDIYISYYNNNSEKKLLYAKVDEDLDSYTSIEYEELLDSYEFELINK